MEVVTLTVQVLEDPNPSQMKRHGEERYGCGHVAEQIRAAPCLSNEKLSGCDTSTWTAGSLSASVLSPGSSESGIRGIGI